MLRNSSRSTPSPTLLTLSTVLSVIAGSAGTAGAGTDSLMGAGVSRALAVMRASQIREVRYALTLDVTGRDSSSGSVTARFRVMRPGDVILDFRGLRLGTVEVNGTPLAAVDYNGAHLRIPLSAVVVGENAVTMAFVTKIAAAGASIIRYRDATDGASTSTRCSCPQTRISSFRASISRTSRQCRCGCLHRRMAGCREWPGRLAAAVTGFRRSTSLPRRSRSAPI